jgi:cell division septation protein DedD
VQDRPAAPRKAWSRVAFAAALSVFILGSFASFGGLGYAAAGATHTYDAVKQAVVKQKLTVKVHTSSAADQYPAAPTTPAPTTPAPTTPTPTTPTPTTPAPTQPAPTQQVAGAHVQKTKPKAKPAPQVAPASTLPFTGFSLAGTLVLSLVLIGAGIMLRRRERRPEA